MKTRLATFNLENLDAGSRARVPLAARLEVLRPQLDRLAADILCLQEINGDAARKGRPHGLSALAALVEKSGLADYEQATTISAASGGALDVHNLAVLSRHPIVETRQLHNDLVAPPHYRMATAEPTKTEAEPVRWDRPLLYARIDLGARHLHVINLHLRSPLAAFVPGQKGGRFEWRSTEGWAEGYFIASMKRAGQALEARLLVDRILDEEPEAWIAVAGDCNAELRAPSLRLLQAPPESTGNPDLSARALIPLETRVPAARRFTVDHAGDRIMLDHLLVSQELATRCQRVDIHNDRLTDETIPLTTQAEMAESFHAPVVAEFDLSG